MSGRMTLTHRRPAPVRRLLRAATMPRIPTTHTTN
jgi:hypothetical protein